FLDEQVAEPTPNAPTRARCARQWIGRMKTAHAQKIETIDFASRSIGRIPVVGGIGLPENEKNSTPGVGEEVAPGKARTERIDLKLMPLPWNEHIAAERVVQREIVFRMGIRRRLALS